MIDLKARKTKLADEYDQAEKQRIRLVKQIQEVEKLMLMLKGAFEEIQHLIKEQDKK